MQLHQRLVADVVAGERAVVVQLLLATLPRQDLAVMQETSLTRDDLLELPHCVCPTPHDNAHSACGLEDG